MVLLGHKASLQGRKLHAHCSQSVGLGAGQLPGTYLMAVQHCQGSGTIAAGQSEHAGSHYNEQLWPASSTRCVCVSISRKLRVGLVNS